MKEKWVLILIGSIIAGAILYPLKKKREADAKKQEEECMKMVDEMVQKAMEEERRHIMAMEDIEKKGEQERKEMDEKFREDMKRLITIIEKDMRNWNIGNTGDLVYHYMMKYRDKNGVIHEFDAGDPKQFREVMKEKTNRLIFD